MDRIAEDVLAIIADKGHVDRARLALDARLADLSIASLDVIEIIFALEERFQIAIPFNANDARQEFDTVGDIVRAVEAEVAQRRVA
ncbi:phosphopantetheine-binding protein [Azospirillum sp.]|uniref:phosphopantetheine-binding protein n=1 Tax=Azospirillum sp. TaxID=34012 RepID=UPI002D2331CA|nr:phosphopantetheine-binding protein [Azospirillum sp.]HYD69115.1 phosphopantetheine-binding protein [Azospirillum sp.]